MCTDTLRDHHVRAAAKLTACAARRHDGMHTCVQVSTATGYSQGEAPDVTYEQVCSGNTGHAEVVQVRPLLTPAATAWPASSRKRCDTGAAAWSVPKADGYQGIQGAHPWFRQHVCAGAVQPGRGVISAAAGGLHQHPQPHTAQPPGVSWYRRMATLTGGTLRLQLAFDTSQRHVSQADMQIC